MTSPRPILEELNLLKCALLPGELLEFVTDSTQWSDLLNSYALDPDCELPDKAECPTARFQLKLESTSDVWFDVELPHDYRNGDRLPTVSVKGDNLGRTEQERWQRVVADALGSVHGSEYPIYELTSTYLFPQLHEALDNPAASAPSTDRCSSAGTSSSACTSDPPAPHSEGKRTPSPRYHALFVSHHLKSAQKRRSLSQWSHELALSGFAKVGYPGVIYCEGEREDVEEFVARVKSMQWLALRLRFVEPAPAPPDSDASAQGVQSEAGQRGRWAEFEKVGEVVEEMRRLRRESFIVEMGIRSAGTQPAR